MIRPVTGTAVAVPPSVISRQELIERFEHVVVRAGSELNHDEAGRGVRHEDDEEAIVHIGFGQKVGAGGGQVNQAGVDPAVDGDLARLHRSGWESPASDQAPVGVPHR